MVKPLQFSIDPALAANAPFLIEKYGTTAGTNGYADVQDTVTLSAAALAASRSSNLSAFLPGNGASVLGEFPVEELLERGYSASQIAIELGIPTEILDADLGIQVFHTAA